MEYLIQGKLDNQVHDITYEQLKLLYDENRREAKEARIITESSYRGENFYDKYGDTYYALEKEYLERDPRTSGTRIYYPHGVIIEQSARKNYYRGENQLFPESLPTLQRTLKQFTSEEDKELYRLVSDMRIAEFSFLLKKFQHVRSWKISDVLYEALAQHYGLETGWLDITSDFEVALFFATCYWDRGQWKPLKREQTEVDEKHQYGMIFHMPSNRMPGRWIRAIHSFTPWTEKPVGKNSDGNDVYGRLAHPIYKGEMENLIYPLGFQPFMRCHMQNGYGIYMRTPKLLQEDYEFEKLRFRHSEELSQRVFEAMRGGELIYPHEGLKQVDFIIEQIKHATEFSEEAFLYALYRNHRFRLADASFVKDKLSRWTIKGEKIRILDRSPWKLSAGRKKRIDELYNDFSLEKWYGIRIIDRDRIPGASPMFEPWMIPEKTSGEGVKDFHIRDTVQCGSSIINRNHFQLLHIIRNARLPDF